MSYDSRIHQFLNSLNLTFLLININSFFLERKSILVVSGVST